LNVLTLHVLWNLTSVLINDEFVSLNSFEHCILVKHKLATYDPAGILLSTPEWCFSIKSF